MVPLGRSPVNLATAFLSGQSLLASEKISVEQPVSTFLRAVFNQLWKERDLKVLKLGAKESKYQVKKKQMHYSNPEGDGVIPSPFARNRKRLDL